MALVDKLTNIANAIRGKTGGTEKLTLDEMATAIEGIESGSSGGGAGSYNVNHKSATTIKVYTATVINFNSLHFNTFHNGYELQEG